MPTKKRDRQVRLAVKGKCRVNYICYDFQILLLLSLVMTIVNLINLIILEVGEWRGFLSHDDREFVRDNGLEDLMSSGDQD